MTGIDRIFWKTQNEMQLAPLDTVVTVHYIP